MHLHDRLGVGIVLDSQVCVLIISSRNEDFTDTTSYPAICYDIALSADFILVQVFAHMREGGFSNCSTLFFPGRAHACHYNQRLIIFFLSNQLEILYIFIPGLKGVRIWLFIFSFVLINENVV